MNKYTINLYICSYMNIYIKYYITMLSHMLLYYIYPCHIHRRGGDGDELTYFSLPLEGLQWVSILEFRSFKVNFEVERINFNR
jgi:hypothetical protein